MSKQTKVDRRKGESTASMAIQHVLGNNLQKAQRTRPSQCIWRKQDEITEVDQREAR